MEEAMHLHVGSLDERRNDENKKHVDSFPFHKLFYFADNYDWFLMVMGTLGAVIHGSAIPVFFFLCGNMINAFGKNQNSPPKMVDEVSKHALNFVYLGLVIMASAWVEIVCWLHAGERLVGVWKKRYLEALLKQDVGLYDIDATSGDIGLTISSETILIQDAISEKLGKFIRSVSTFAAGLVMGFILTWRLALLSLAVIPGISFVGAFYGDRVRKLTAQCQEADADATKIAEEVVGKVRTVYCFVGEERALDSYSEALEISNKVGYKGGEAKGLEKGYSYGITFVSLALLCWYAGVLIGNGQTDAGKAFAAIFCVMVGGMSLAKSLFYVHAFGKGMLAGCKLMETIKQKPGTILDVSGGEKLTDVQGGIRFQDVSFSYPCRPDVAVLRDFCLEIPSGKSLALVGESGSGKSTVVALIERFYDPDEGHVFLDGHDLRTLELKWLRQQIGLITQEPALFSTTILQNILYGKEDATLEEVKAAASAANVDNFVKRFAAGYNTLVGEGGIQLSTVQKQRIAIARAILKKPKILLLDEATSTLDADSETMVEITLDSLMTERTTIIISHHLPFIRNADAIAVLESGSVIELGNHEELVDKDGVYSSMIRVLEMGMTKDGSPTLSYSSSTKSLSHSPSNLTTLTNQHSTETDERPEMTLNAIAHKINPLLLGSFFRLLKLNEPEWRYALLGAAGSILLGLIGPTFAIVIGNMLEAFYYTDDKEMKRKATTYVFIYIGVGIYVVLGYLCQHYYFGVVGVNLTARIRKMMLAAILRNEVSWFDEEENNPRRVASCLAADAKKVKSETVERISIILQNMTSLLVSFVVAFILEWRIALLILAIFPLLVLSYFAQQISIKGFGRHIPKAYARTSMIEVEAVKNKLALASFNAQDKILTLFGKELKFSHTQNLKQGLLAGALFGLSQLSFYGLQALILWYGSRLVQNGTSTFPRVIEVFLVLVITAYSAAETLRFAPDFAKSGEASSSIFAILDRGTKTEPDDKDAEEVEEIKGDIELSHINFAYPIRPQVMIFKDLNLKIKGGSTHALVGARGSGKSSLFALIERFYDPISGQISIDGKDIKKLNLKSLRLNIGLVQQEPVLFATTIYDNIVYGRENATETEIIEAAKAADVHNFITSLANGYQTMVGQMGVQLSNGHMYKIAIARAVLKNPGLLLLDECTSALDAESESIVHKGLKRLMEGRTTVMVAHLLSTTCNVDSIAVIHHGRIVEHGTHRKLLECGPHYCRLLHI